MTPQEQKVMEQALEALSKSDDFLFDWHENESDNEADAYAIARQLNEKAITAIKETLAQQSNEQVEPVACVAEVSTFDGYLKKEVAWNKRVDSFAVGTKFFAHLPAPTAQLKKDKVK